MDRRPIQWARGDVGVHLVVGVDVLAVRVAPDRRHAVGVGRLRRDERREDPGPRLHRADPGAADERCYPEDDDTVPRVALDV